MPSSTQAFAGEAWVMPRKKAKSYQHLVKNWWVPLNVSCDPKQAQFANSHWQIRQLIFVISQNHPEFQRKVSSVKLVLTSVLQSTKQGADAAKVPESSQTLEQSVVPHNDFFSAQFLLPFSITGLHQVLTFLWFLRSNTKLTEIHFHQKWFKCTFPETGAWDMWKCP